MSLYQNRYRVESTRLPNWDYSKAGWYFLTTVTRNRACLFGEIVAGQMEFNALGQIVQSCWDDLPNHYPTMIPDSFVIMPNHVHMIIGLQDVDEKNGGEQNVVAGRDNLSDGDHDFGDRNDGRIVVAGRGNLSCRDNVETCLRPVSTGTTALPVETTVTGPKTVWQPRVIIPETFPETNISDQLATPPKRGPVSEIIRAFKSFSSRRINEWRNTPGTPVWQPRFHDRIVRDQSELNRIRRYIALNPAQWDRDRNQTTRRIPQARQNPLSQAFSPSTGEDQP